MKTIIKMKTIKFLALLFISILTFSSWWNDDNESENEEELITDIIYTLTDGTSSIVMTYTDPDGQGGAVGTYTVVGTLSANSTYIGSIRLENSTENPVENVTEEIEEEKDEHEFFYGNTAGLTITKTDVDSNGYPVGLSTSIATGAAGSGTINIVLKHMPSKPNDGTADGAGGSTDFDVTFNVTVQ